MMFIIQSCRMMKNIFMKYILLNNFTQRNLFQSFGLVDKRSIKVDGIKEFSWSPTDNTVAYWIAENNEVPAKVALMSLPNKEEVRTAGLPIE